MAFWLEERGYGRGVLLEHGPAPGPGGAGEVQGVLSVGHDEYWSREMFDNMVAARDAGDEHRVLLGELVYWEIEFHESEVGGAPCRVFSAEAAV